MKIWAHRGASSDAPENTLEAFRLAVEQGADGIELDVQMSADGALVVIHDETLNRVSDGSGFVKDRTLAELKALDFSKPRPGYGRVRIPELSEVYRLVKETRLIVNVEIKSGIIPYEGIELKLLQLERDMGMQGRILYSSFNHFSLLTLRDIKPNAAIGLLYADGWAHVPEYAKALNANAIHPSKYNMWVPNLTEHCHALGIAVHPWTIDAEEEIRAMADMQVDAIITNRPAFAIRVYRSHYGDMSR